MYTAYVLRDKTGKIYKGLTKNLERRLKEHKGGHTKTTRKMIDLEIVYIENCGNFDEAREREKYLKSAAGRRFLKDKLGPLA